MATASSASFREAGRTLSLVRLPVAVGLTSAVVFVICWLGTFIPFSSPTHAYIGLFTYADFNSGQALVEGTCWSLLFGILVGAVFAIIYNATAAFDRK